MAAEGELICRSCGKRFSESSVLSYDYFIQNLTCFSCCQQLAKQPSNKSCFGKKGLYDEEHIDCGRFCPDRQVCVMFIDDSIGKARDLTEAARKSALRFIRKPKKARAPVGPSPFRSGSIIGKGFALCMQGCTVEQLSKLCDKEGADIKRLLRFYRHEQYQGHEWNWSESGRDLRIVYPRAGA